MHFKQDKFYTHRSMLDVCFRVIDQDFEHNFLNELPQVLVVSWYLKKNLRPLGVSDIITVDHTQSYNYREVA